MRNQSSSLVVFIVVTLAVLSHCAPPDHNVKENEIAVDDKFKPDPKIPKALDPRFNKMVPILDILNDSTLKAKKPLTTKDETSTIGKLKFDHKNFHIC
jgi:hypothetical protein